MIYYEREDGRSKNFERQPSTICTNRIHFLTRSTAFNKSNHKTLVLRGDVICSIFSIVHIVAERGFRILVRHDKPPASPPVHANQILWQVDPLAGCCLLKGIGMAIGNVSRVFSNSLGITPQQYHGKTCQPTLPEENKNKTESMSERKMAAPPPTPHGVPPKSTTGKDLDGDTESEKKAKEGRWRTQQ